MGSDDAPTFRQANPGLTLAAVSNATRGESREFDGDFSEVVAEGEDVEAVDGAGEVGGRASFAECDDLFDSVEILGGAEADRVRRGPEHGDQPFDLVGNEGGFVAAIELGEFADDSGIVDEHQKRRLSGRMLFAMAALTVIMGSFTTWLRRRCMATLHRM